MTRTKTKPPLSKPVFDAEEVIRFASTGPDQVGDVGPAAEEVGRGQKSAKKADANRSGLTMRLSPEVVARLRAEADRKGKTIEQVVEKLVTKHLGKH